MLPRGGNRRFQPLEEQNAEQEARIRRNKLLNSLTLSKAIALCVGIAIVIIVAVAIVVFVGGDSNRRSPIDQTSYPTASYEPAKMTPMPPGPSYDPYTLKKDELKMFDQLLQYTSSTNRQSATLRLIPLFQDEHQQTNRQINQVESPWSKYTYFNNYGEPVWLLHVKSGGTRIFQNRTTEYPTGKVPMEGDGPLMACQQISMENMPTLHVVQVTPYIQEVSDVDAVESMTLSSCQKLLNSDGMDRPNNCIDGNICSNLLLKYHRDGKALEFPPEAGMRIGPHEHHRSLVLSVNYSVSKDAPIPSQGVLDSSGFILHVTPRLRKYDTLPISWNVKQTPKQTNEYKARTTCSSLNLYYMLHKSFGKAEEIKAFLFNMYTGSPSDSAALELGKSKINLPANKGSACSQEVIAGLESIEEFQNIPVAGANYSTAESSRSTFYAVGMPWYDQISRIPNQVSSPESPEMKVDALVKLGICNTDSSHALCQLASDSYYDHTNYNPFSLRSGDELRGQCLYDNQDEDRTEMCSFMLYVYPVDGNTEFPPPISTLGAQATPKNGGSWYSYDNSNVRNVVYSAYWGNHCSESATVANVTCDTSGDWVVAT